MKGTTLFTLLTILAVAANAQKPFVIKGRIDGLTGEKMILLDYPGHTDSVLTKNGRFTLSGIVFSPVKARLELRSVHPGEQPDDLSTYLARDMRDIFLDSAQTITVKGRNIKQADIKGGKTQMELAVLKTGSKSLQDSMLRVAGSIAQLAAADPLRATLQDSLSALRERMDLLEDTFILAHGHSYVSLSLLDYRARYIDPATFEPLFMALTAELRNSPTGVNIAKALALAKQTAVGSDIIDFTQTTISGQPFTLSAIKGKYILIDFWASWCRPCREDNPHVVAAYNALKDKPFEIVSISLDDKKEPWQQAIEKDHLAWIHVSDLKGWRNEVAALYGIHAIPQNFLVSPEGRIIAKNLHGMELTEKLQALIK